MIGYPSGQDSYPGFLAVSRKKMAFFMSYKKSLTKTQWAVCKHMYIGFYFLPWGSRCKKKVQHSTQKIFFKSLFFLKAGRRYGCDCTRKHWNNHSIIRSKLVFSHCDNTPRQNFLNSAIRLIFQIEIISHIKPRSDLLLGCHWHAFITDNYL